jgi:ABC-type branched-subunit amino acid transport system ATPase component
MTNEHEVNDPIISKVRADVEKGWFDRFYFNLHDKAHGPYVLMGAGVYPGTRVIDGYVLFIDEHRQRSIRFSDIFSGPDIPNKVWPFSWQTLEANRLWRIAMERNPFGIEFDLLWEARAPRWECEPIEVEDRRVAGRPVRLAGPRDAIRAGMALVPEDRKQQGLVLEMAVRENVTLAGLDRAARAGVFLDKPRERRESAAAIENLRIRTPDPGQIVQFLSGGNQQKVVLAKWLSLEPKILLLDEPTRGIDVGAKQEVYQLMDRLAASGVAVLFVSSELEEVLGLSDRALVMHEGRLAGELPRERLSEEAVMRLATGRELAAAG